MRCGERGRLPLFTSAMSVPLCLAVQCGYAREFVTSLLAHKTKVSRYVSVTKCGFLRQIANFLPFVITAQRTVITKVLLSETQTAHVAPCEFHISPILRF